MRVQPHVEDYIGMIERKADKIIELNQENPYPPGSILLVIPKTRANASMRVALQDKLAYLLSNYNQTRRLWEYTNFKSFWIGPPNRENPELWINIVGVSVPTVTPFNGPRARYYSDSVQLKKAVRASVVRRAKNILKVPLDIQLKKFETLNRSLDAIINNLNTLRNLPNILEEMGLYIHDPPKCSQLSNIIREVDKKFSRRRLIVHSPILYSVRCRQEREMKRMAKVISSEIKNGGFDDVLQVEEDLRPISQPQLVDIWSKLPDRVVKVFYGESKSCLVPIINTLLRYDAIHYYQNSFDEFMENVENAVGQYNRCIDSIEFIADIAEKLNLPKQDV